MLVVCLAVAFAADPSPEPEPPKETAEQLIKRLVELPAKALKEAKTDDALTDALFKSVLKKPPTEEQRRRVVAYFDRKQDRLLVCRDIVWALMNTKEFAAMHKLSVEDWARVGQKVQSGWDARPK